MICFPNVLDYIEFPSKIKLYDLDLEEIQPPVAATESCRVKTKQLKIGFIFHYS